MTSVLSATAEAFTTAVNSDVNVLMKALGLVKGRKVHLNWVFWSWVQWGVIVLGRYVALAPARWWGWLMRDAYSVRCDVLRRWLVISALSAHTFHRVEGNQRHNQLQRLIWEGFTVREKQRSDYLHRWAISRWTAAPRGAAFPQSLFPERRWGQRYGWLKPK